MAYTYYFVKDNAEGRLDAAINNNSMAITLQSGQGAKFEDSGNSLPSSARPAICTLVKYNTAGDESSGIAKSEKITITGVSGDVLTVGERGHDGDTPQAFDEGDYLYIFMSESIVEELYKAVNDTSLPSFVVSGSSSTLYRRGQSKTDGIFIDEMGNVSIGRTIAQIGNKFEAVGPVLSSGFTNGIRAGVTSEFFELGMVNSGASLMLRMRGTTNNFTGGETVFTYNYVNRIWTFFGEMYTRDTRPSRIVTESSIDLVDGSTINTDLSQGNIFGITLGTTRYFAFPTNGVDAQLVVYRVTQGASAGGHIIWDSGFNFGDFLDRSLSTTPGKVDYINFRMRGTSKLDFMGIAKNY